MATTTRRDRPTKPYVGLPMEGGTARRYANQRSSGAQLASFQRQARELTAGLPDGAAILEVAPGPGYLAIEMARDGRFHVAGLDVSQTFVELAGGKARESGVTVEFHLGDVAEMPFPSDSFDLVVTQAAFKNFSRPAQALGEMHRVLRPGGTAVIDDMTRDASGAAITKEVREMDLGPAGALMTNLILRWLRRRAYSPADLNRLVVASPFGTCDIRTEGIGLEVRMRKQANS